MSDGDRGAFTMALALQQQAAAEGFDWPDLPPMWDKLAEEIDELRRDCSDVRRAKAELGDVLFMVVNIARRLGVDPEQALAESCRRFAARYAHVVADPGALPPPGDPRRLAAMERRWQQAKRAGIGEDGA